MTTRDHERLIRLKPREYVHILDNNAGVTRLEVGPQRFTLQDHEVLATPAQQMVVIPPRHYAVIEDPVEREAEGTPRVNANGQAMLSIGEREVRFSSEPFPLYPGELLLEPVQPLQMVLPDAALWLRALRAFEDDAREEQVSRNAGDEWLFEGPATYHPRVDVEVVTQVEALIVGPQQALKMRARKALIDREGQPRRAGEEWLMTRDGAYLPGVAEEVVEVVEATTLSEREWCVISDPVDTEGCPQLGRQEIRRGRCTFFLHPGESFAAKIQEVYVLGEEEALLLQARERFRDEDRERPPGDRWMLRGPAEYIPRIEVEVLERRQAIPLDKNDGLYVRNNQTGEIRLLRGPRVYMLASHESLWEKPLPSIVEQLLSQDPILDRFSGVREDAELSDRDRSRAVVFQVPQGAASKIYDFKAGEARVVFGPDLVMLEPEEMFTVLSLSGGRPKRPCKHRSLALLLGPDFMVDHVIVETSDHAQLRLQLAYVWHFDVAKTEGLGDQLFAVPDYVGHACNTIASRIRGTVAGVRFDEFHRNQAQIIRDAVFGEAEPRSLHFHQNNLTITNIDIQSVEPIDEETRLSLQRSVQIAIKISTDAQEAAAKHDAERVEQQAKAKLLRQSLVDERSAEAERLELLHIQAQASSVSAVGAASAEAKARTDALRIEAEMQVEIAKMRAEAENFRSEAEIIQLRERQLVEAAHAERMNSIDVERQERLAKIEVERFRAQVDAIGADTLRSIAQAGPEMQAKLLGGLGLNSVLITDGRSPINLFSTAKGLIQSAAEAGGDDEVSR